MTGGASSNAENDAALSALATRLGQECGRGRVVHLEPLSGGRNNRVFRADTESGEPAVLKSYFRDARDPRDRRLAEWTFLSFASQRGVTTVPAPLATDADAGASLLGFVKGRRLKPGEVTEAHMQAALRFVTAINPAIGYSQPGELSDIPAASEACFSMAEHVATVERRVARLASLDPSAPSGFEAAAFVARELTPAWHLVSSRLAKSVAADAERAAGLVDESDIIYSPSDFGFHNALVDDDGRVSFLDFEYAGRDDPAKLLCDFFCQPDVPVDQTYFTEFWDQWAGSDCYRWRASLLLDAYRIRWACIMLNDFLPLGDARRSFAEQSRRADRCAAQLAKARAALAAIETCC